MSTSGAVDGSFLAQARQLVAAAAAETPVPAARAELEGALIRLDEPLRVAIAGKVKAGKSTLLNALVGEALAPTDAGECTRIVTWYRDGTTYRVELVPRDGEAVQVPFERREGSLDVDLGDREPGEVDRLLVTWPSQRLRQLTLVDTPGIDSVSVDVSGRTLDFLTPESGRATQADAVIYLMRHLHATDVRFLEAFHDDELARATPVNALGVLSRADEVGACRPDAMMSAARIAARYDADPRVRRLCATVVPVAGLLAQAAATLSEAEYQALGAISEAPAELVDELVLSVDHFSGAEVPVAPPAEQRRRLVERLGLFGVRVALEALASGQAPSASILAQHLSEVSGIEALRRELANRFAHRAGVLQARSALAVFDAVVASGGLDAASELAARREQIEAGAHELTEVRILDALRHGDLGLRAEELGVAERLVRGGPVAERLGLAPDAGAPEVRAAVEDAIGRWQTRAEHPLSSQPARDVSRALVRSLEGMLAVMASEERGDPG